MTVPGSKSEGRRGNALRIQIVGETEEARVAVIASLATVGDPPIEVMEVAPNLPGENGAAPMAELAMVVFNGNEAAALGYLQAQSERSPRPLLFGLLPERSPALMRRALRAGADELMFLPLDPSDIARALMKLTESRRKEERAGAGGGGLIYSVTSAVGGTGVTSLCGNLALALRYAFDKRVAVVDLALQTGGLGIFLYLDPDQSIAALEHSVKLDSIRLEAALTKHASGIYLLAAPRRIEDSELVSDLTIEAVLSLMRQLFDFVVVDCGRHVDENAVAAWARSDEVLYVLDHSLYAARAVHRFMEFFGRLGLRELEPRFVLNKYNSQSPLPVDQIERELQGKIFARIPRDDRAMERAELRAQDLWQSSGAAPMKRATEQLARRLTIRREPAADTAGGLFARLFSALGARA
ncbi:MAG: AAA family ATPase [Candidatus Binataceae bacterium]